MSERSSFSIGPNLENEKGDEAKKLYEAHQNDPNNPQPIADAKKHYEENTEAYQNQAAMDMSAAGKDVNTSTIKHNTTGTVINVGGGTLTARIGMGEVNTEPTTTEGGDTRNTTVITGEHKGDLVIDMDNLPGDVRVEGANIEGDFTIK